MKILSLFCSLVLILLTVSPVAFCASPENCLTLPENYSHIDSFSFESKNTVYSRKYFSGSADSEIDYTQFFGRLLNKYEKVFYDKLCTVDYSTRTLEINFSRNLTQEEFEKISIQRIADAFFLDHPEFFWLTDFSIYYTPVEENGKTTYKDFYVSLSIGLEYNGLFSSLSKKVDEFNSAVKNLNLSQSSRYDFIKSLHDYLCNKITYNLYAKRCYDAYGALVDGKAVCQGYSEAFKMVCDIYKVPCICVIGVSQNENHMWNAVQMEDGKWYFVDCTWDDQVTVIIYDYFLCGLKTVDTYDNEAFDVSHNIRYKNSDDEQYDCLLLEYPIFNDSVFQLTEDNHYLGFYLSKGFIADKENKTLYTSFFNSTSTVYYNGLYKGDYTTGPVFKGDIDGDGVITTQDALFSLRINLKNVSYTDAQFSCADIDGNGKLTMDEARKVLRVASGIDYPFITDFSETQDEVTFSDERNISSDWKILRFGDVNNDKLCDTTDYNIVSAKANANTVVSTETDFLCDADGNGIINSEDAELYYSAINGQYDFSNRF